MSLLTQTRPLETALTSTGLDVAMLVEYGSRAHGTATDASDHDLFGLFIEHDHQVYGLDSADSHNFRLHADGELELMALSLNPAPASADDVEMTIHPLRKYVRLAAAGNPTIFSTLWTPELLQVKTTPASELLMAHRNAFLSKHVGFRHAGYARAQRQGLLGQGNKRTNRPSLILEHGYDTKYGAHLIRLLFAGLDLVRERTVHLPMKPEQVEFLLEIRRGDVDLDDLVTLSEKLEHELTTETEDSDLPESVDYDAMNNLLRTIRNEHLGR